MLGAKEQTRNDENRKVPTVFDKFIEQRMIEETEDEGFYTITQEYYKEMQGLS